MEAAVSARWVRSCAGVITLKRPPAVGRLGGCGTRAEKAHFLALTAIPDQVA